MSFHQGVPFICLVVYALNAGFLLGFLFQIEFNLMALSMWFWPIDESPLASALGRSPKVRPCWRHSKQITLLHFATCGSTMSSITFITAENVCNEQILKLTFVSETGLSISTTCRLLLNLLHIICDYFWQSVKLQILPVWTIYTANKMAKNGYFAQRWSAAVLYDAEYLQYDDFRVDDMENPLPWEYSPHVQRWVIYQHIPYFRDHKAQRDKRRSPS